MSNMTYNYSHRLLSTGTKIKRVHEKETQTKINDYIKGNETIKIICSKVNSMCTCIHACMHVNIYNLLLLGFSFDNGWKIT